MFGSKTSDRTNDNVVFDFLKGLIVASLLSLGLIVLFAFCLKWFSLSDNVILPITLLIKMISVVIGSLIAVKGDSKGLLKGVLFGLIYILFAFVIFSFLAGTFNIGLSFLLDIVAASLLGGIVGIIKVNRK